MTKTFSKEKDKILVISNMYPSAKDPIYGNFVQEQHDLLKASGYNVELSKITERDGTPVQKITKYLKLFADSFVKALDPRVKIIHYHYEYPTALMAPFFKKVLKKKIFLTVHGPRVLEHTGWKKKLIHSFFNASDYVVGVSDYLKSELETVYRLNPEKVLSLHCGVNTEMFSPADAETQRKLLDLPLDKQLVLYIGRIHEEKGMDYYSRVVPDLIRNHPERYFLFVGNGPHTAYLEELKTQFPDQVEYRTGVPKEQVPHYFSAADLFVFPTKMETFGLVALEALSTQTLVVAARIGGVPEIIQNGERGFLFEDQNEDELRMQVEDALSLSAEEKERIHRNGRRFAEENTTQHQLEKLLVFYEKV